MIKLLILTILVIAPIAELKAAEYTYNCPIPSQIRFGFPEENQFSAKGFIGSLPISYVNKEGKRLPTNPKKFKASKLLTVDVYHSTTSYMVCKYELHYQDNLDYTYVFNLSLETIGKSFGHVCKEVIGPHKRFVKGHVHIPCGIIAALPCVPFSCVTD